MLVRKVNQKGMLLGGEDGLGNTSQGTLYALNLNNKAFCSFKRTL